jgi:hypothetical protein
MTETPLTRALNLELRRLDAAARRLADRLETAEPAGRASALLLLQSINRALGDLADEVRHQAPGAEAGDRAVPAAAAV